MNETTSHDYDVKYSIQAILKYTLVNVNTEHVLQAVIVLVVERRFGKSKKIRCFNYS